MNLKQSLWLANRVLYSLEGTAAVGDRRKNIVNKIVLDKPPASPYNGTNLIFKQLIKKSNDKKK